MEEYKRIPISRKLKGEEERHMVSDWLNQRSISRTHYGNITNLEWCRREADRIGGCEILHYTPTNKICVIRWRTEDGEIFRP